MLLTMSPQRRTDRRTAVNTKGRRAVALTTAAVLAAAGMVVATPVAHADPSEGHYLVQRTVSGIDSMPSLPDGINIIDWKERAHALDEFLYNADWQSTPGRKWATIVDDDTYGGWMMPAFYGDIRAASADTAHMQESITITGSLFNSSIAGIDKDVQYPGGEPGETYLDSAKKFFRPTGGVFTNFVGSSGGIPTQQPYNDFWYVMLANLNFYRVASMYPDWVQRDPQVQEYLTSVADRMCDMIDNLGGENFAFPNNIKGYNFDTDTVITSSNAGTQPDAAAAVSMILLYAWRHTGNSDYLQHAKWALNFLDNLEGVNPYYELAALEALTAASILNAVEGTNYNIEKFMGWVIGGNATYRNGWNGHSRRVGNIDIGGYTGDSQAYFFNSIYPLTTLVQLAKYDPSWAKAAGRWALNLTNTSQYALPELRAASDQDNPEFLGKPEASVMAYEAINASTLKATGDAMKSWNYWGTGPEVTNLATYGMIYTGVLGGLVEKTNVENILRFNANKTDYFTDGVSDAKAVKYPTWLYYNPYQTVKDVQIDVGSTARDIFDSTKGIYLAKNVTGTQTFKMLGDSATVIVLLPPNSPDPVVSAGTTTIGGALISHSTADTLPLPGSDPVEHVSITGPTSIASRGAATQYSAEVAPETAISKDVIWTVTDPDGQPTTKATITSQGVLTPAKNGQILVRATATDGSGLYSELQVTLTGQTLAYLSVNKPVTVSDTIDQAKERINDGDTGTRWNGKSGTGNDGHPWAYIDLLNPAELSLITVEWEAAYAKDFRIQYSNDASTWTDIQVFTNQSLSNHAITRVSEDSLAALQQAEPDGVRYVRMYTDAMHNSGWGISIYELSIDGSYNITQPVTSISVSAEEGATEITRRHRPLQMSAVASPGDATDQRVEWYVYDEDGEETTLAEIDSTGRLLPQGNGRVMVVAKSVDGSGISGEYFVDITGQDNPNLAQGRPITASQSELAAVGANDGDYTTRWSSGSMSADARASLEVDLGDVKTIESATVLWEVAAPPSFDLQVRASSSDSWTTVVSGSSIPGEFQDLDFDPVRARYVRLANMPRSNYGGISVWEFEVYGALVDRSELAEVLDQVEGLDETSYTTSSWAALESARVLAIDLLETEDVTQEDLDAARVSLTEAIAQLEHRGDPVVLETLIEVVDGLTGKLDGFTPASVEALTVALNAAKDVLIDREDVTQPQLDAALSALQSALDGLQPRAENVNVLVLRGVLDGVGGLSNADGRYTGQSWAVLESAIAAAQGVLVDPGVTQGQVDAAVVALTEAVAGLELVPMPVDKGVLQAVYASAVAVSNAGGRYTAASWSRLQSVLTEARQVLSDPNVTQVQVDGVVASVSAAVAGLVPVSPAVSSGKARVAVLKVAGKKRFKPGKKFVVRVRISAKLSDGRATKGKVRVFVGKKRVKTVKLKAFTKGKAKVTIKAKFAKGKKVKVKVKYVPKSKATTAGKTSKTITLKRR
ncbi:Uncharacterised Sugar-binding Domain [Micrococcales bacterium KH10]|nr:Uncharacterised Sugar-binding Domain [Micrococcales bacterium KH10]